MSKKSQYISTNRSKHYLKCHLILVTKYRRNILVGQLNDDLKSIFTSIANCSDFEIKADLLAQILRLSKLNLAQILKSLAV